MHDSTADTNAHIERVRELIAGIQYRLTLRAVAHDLSKLQEPEKSAYDRLVEYKATHNMVYGSPEYAEGLKILGPALEHHYAHNDHHPEHTPEGINGMSLLSLTEWLVDCKAASERSGGALVLDFKRFGIDPQLARILENTVKELGW